MDHETGGRQLLTGVAAIQKSGSTALEPLLPRLGLTREQLDDRWRPFCRTTYGRE